MNYVRRTISKTLILLVCAALIAAQSSEHKPLLKSERLELSQQASLEETQNWLKEQISTHSSYKLKTGNSRNTGYRVEAIRFEGRLITMKEVITDTSKAGKLLSTHTTKSKANLTDLDYMRVVLDRRAVKNSGNYTVHAYTRGNRSLVHFFYEFRSRRSTTRTNKPMGQMSFVSKFDKIVKTLRVGHQTHSRVTSRTG